MTKEKKEAKKASIKDLQKQIEELDTKNREYVSDLQRLQAEFENFTNRSEKENQLFKEFRNIEAKIKRIENGKIATVSGDIIAEAKRLMVKELFKTSSEDEIKMLID